MRKTLAVLRLTTPLLGSLALTAGAATTSESLSVSANQGGGTASRALTVPAGATQVAVGAQDTAFVLTLAGAGGTCTAASNTASCALRGASVLTLVAKNTRGCLLGVICSTEASNVTVQWTVPDAPDLTARLQSLETKVNVLQTKLDGLQAGPQGPQGVPGPQGPQGVPGPSGTAGSFGTNTSLGAAGSGRQCTVGEVILSAGTVVNGTPAAGQLLSIQQNVALFSLLGNIYGGDGRTSFALPDLRAQAPNGLTYSICTVGVFPNRL